jgi:hypothetical protein
LYTLPAFPYSPQKILIVKHLPMKKYTLMAGIAAFSSIASGQTVIDICGSTAGRGAVNAQILNMLSGETYAYEGSNANGSSRAIFHGSFGGQPYIIRTAFSGSVEGVRFIANPGPPSSAFLLTTILGTTAGQSLGTVTASQLADVNDITSRPEIGFSDVFQTSTLYGQPPVSEEASVGVIPFKWFKNEGAPAGLTNITSLLARALYQSLGELPLSMFTGVGTDTSVVYSLGRDASSGSRITAMAEIGHGVFRGVNQYEATVSSGSITDLIPKGNAGSSGSSIAAQLGATWTVPTATEGLPPGTLVAYLGSSDWNAAQTAGAVELSYNGVPYSEANVREGRYTFWGYLHQNRVSMASGSPARAFADTLKTNLRAAPGSLLITEASMRVLRDGDGAAVLNKQ